MKNLQFTPAGLFLNALNGNFYKNSALWKAPICEPIIIAEDRNLDIGYLVVNLQTDEEIFCKITLGRYFKEFVVRAHIRLIQASPKSNSFQYHAADGDVSLTGQTC